MSKIIDCESVKNILTDELDKCKSLEFKESADDRERLLKEILGKVEMISQTATEVKPVVHAHWEIYRLNSWDGNHDHDYVGTRCTHCMEDCKNVESKYCPYCGAIMDEDQED